MQYGLWISASAAATQMHRQNVFSNNLANIDTVGFKHDTVGLKARESARAEDGLFHLPSNRMLEKLAAGVVPMPTRASSAQGPVETTGNSTDIALQGAGYLAVPADNDAGLALTRDGRLTIGSDGVLRRATSGEPVLGDDGKSIQLDRSQTMTVTIDGTIQQGGNDVARLMLVAPPEGVGLQKAGATRFELPSGMTSEALQAAEPRVIQAALEKSTVDPVKSMMQVTAAGRAAQRGIGIAGQFGEIMNSAISRLGRVS